MNKNFGCKFDNSYLSLPKCFYTPCMPNPVHSPKVFIFNDELAESIGLKFSTVSLREKALLFSGNMTLNTGGYFAQAYAGHQFGNFNILGDGRAIIWGEHITPNSARLDIQFKGSGVTPYSRGGDGRAALGPMLREYIISEAMYYLGISTTRSLAVVKTGEHVIREKILPGAILTRIASSFLRIGTFEFARYKNNISIIQSLLDYTLARHYPELTETKNKAIALLKAVVERQADLIVQWMRVGFIHGVMNTDNTTLTGETIDYGPCAFIDSYSSQIVFSSIDYRGRYAYQNQPNIIRWNLEKLAISLLPLIHKDIAKAIDIAQEIIGTFFYIYQNKWLLMMRNKLGLLGNIEGDIELIEDLLVWMENNSADFTITFHDLSKQYMPTNKCYESKDFNQWYQRWQNRLKKNSQPFKQTVKIMRSVNPVIIPRNHMVEEAIEKAYTGEKKPLHNLLEALKSPYIDNKIFKKYKVPPSQKECIYQTFCGT